VFRILDGLSAGLYGALFRVNPGASSSGSSPLPDGSDAPLGLLASDWVGLAA